jgi:DNA polymerase-3 subunit delta'
LFAAKAALRVLAGESARDRSGLDVREEDPAARLVQAGSHPDLMVLERLPKESGGDSARSITVDQVRGLQRLFVTTASIASWRVVVIDAIDDLERAAANALLKNLEEPPPRSLFLLVCHAPHRLLPTIRSRCRHLRLSYVDDDAMTSALSQAIPDASEEEVAALREAGRGSIGRAIAYRGLDIDSLDQSLRSLASSGDATNGKRSQLAQALSSKSAQPRYEAFLQRVPSIIADTARQRDGQAFADALRLWERSSELARTATHLSLDPQAVVFELAGLVAALAPTREKAR